MKTYTINEMKRAFECGRNFQLTGENNFQELIEELNEALLLGAVSGKRPNGDFRDFLIWLVRVAKIEVIDVETAIEMNGYQSKVSPLVPVLTIDELIEEYRAACASSAVDTVAEREPFDCYEIHRPNIPANGCKTQCEECAAWKSSEGQP